MKAQNVIDDIYPGDEKVGFSRQSVFPFERELA
jgi:hypothetical protein